ncbi:Serine/threonine-protein kinase PknD [compost metagenome]
MSRPSRRLSWLSVALLLSGCVSAATVPAPVTPSPEPVPSEAPQASPVVTPTVAPSFRLDGEVRFRGEPQAGGKLTVTDLVTGVAVAPAVTTDARGRFGHTLVAKAGSAWLVRAEFSGSALEAVAVVPEGASSLTVVLDASTTAGAPIAAAFAQAAARLPEAGRAAALQKALAAIAPITTSIQRAIEANPATANAFVTASPAAEARGASLVGLYGLAEARQHVVGAVKDLLTGALAPAEAASTRLSGTRLRLDWAAGEAVPTLVNEDTGRSASLTADARMLEVVWRPTSGGSSSNALVAPTATITMPISVTSLAVDSLGNAWAVHDGSHFVVRVPAGAVDNTGNTTFNVTGPQTIRVDASNNAWVGANNKVVRIPAGATTDADATTFTVNGVYDLVISNGVMWAGNPGTGEVAGVPVGASAPHTPDVIATGATNVHHLSADALGNLWAVHLGSSKLVRIPADRSANATFDTEVQPIKAAVGGGNVWVINQATNVVDRFASGAASGTASAKIIPLGSSLANKPSNVAVDASGNAWVTVPNLNQVIRIPAGATDNTGQVAFDTANGPGDLLIDTNGTVWVSHPGVAVVTRIAPGAIDNSGVTSHAIPLGGYIAAVTPTHLWFRSNFNVVRVVKP